MVGWRRTKPAARSPARHVVPEGRARRGSPGDRTPYVPSEFPPGPPDPAYNASGSIFSGSISSSRIALTAFDGASAPQRASETSVAGSDVRRVDLEQRPQVLARVAAPEAVGAEREVVGRQPARDHVGERLHPVGRGDDRPAVDRQDLADVRHARGLRVGVEPVPALGLERIAPEQRERRGAVDLGGNPEPLGQQVARGEDLLEDRA